MLQWEIKNGDDKLKSEIQRTKHDFDNWFKNYWEKQCTREKMLSEDSPVKHIYYKMTKTFDEVKEKYPYEALRKCSDCGEHVDQWIETHFSFCDEYDCGIALCKKCVNKLKELCGQMK